MNLHRVEANGVEFAYIEQGEGPLALCLHGFADTPGAFRHLAPELVKAGYRVVAPYLRGIAPTQVPIDGMGIDKLIADANDLHEKLGGGSDAVIIGHDWGGFMTWGAAAHAPERWSRVVVLDVPPLEFYGRKAADPALIHKNVHFYFFQMAMADHIVAANDFAYLDWLWEHWSGNIAGFDSTQERQAAKESLRDPANLHAALALYRENFPVDTFGTDRWKMGAALSRLPEQPTLYLHGSEDPVIDADAMVDLVAALAPGSDGHLIQGAGHFPLLEKPDEVNRLITKFLQR